MMIILLFSATLIYFIERGAQPDNFGSIPAAAWWALSTLTTIGYGDVVPITPWGKLFGGVVMLLGLGMFTLPIAILAAGFSQESSRHEFVVTWSMVARVPLFSTMDVAEVAEITKLLQTRTIAAGATIVHPGESVGGMFLIASGEAVISPTSKGRHVDLREGDFFGEMALLEQRPHEHAVVAKTICRVYVLDAEALARLSRRHPAIVKRIREVARARTDNVATASRRKSRASKLQEPEAP